MYIPELPYYKQLNDTLSSKALEVAIGTMAKEIGTKQVANVYKDMAIEITEALTEDHFNQWVYKL